MPCLVNKVSIKYSDEMYLHHMMSYKLIKGGNNYVPMFKNSARIWRLHDKINVAHLFRTKYPSLARCKEGNLPLFHFSNLTCMVWSAKLSEVKSELIFISHLLSHTRYFRYFKWDWRGHVNHLIVFSCFLWPGKYRTEKAQSWTSRSALHTSSIHSHTYIQRGGWA